MTPIQQPKPPRTQPPPPMLSPPPAVTTKNTKNMNASTNNNQKNNNSNSNNNPTPVKNTYRSARNLELEALRQKGLAKIFNKHFTSVADKIRQEREAAELALVEIIKRKEELKINPKSFKEGGLTLTQLDKLYMELKKRKNEVYRKERETQELYKRYCSQYGENNDYVTNLNDDNDPVNITAWKNGFMSPDHVNGGVSGGMGYVDMIRQTDLVMAKANDERYRHHTNAHEVQKLSNNIDANANPNNNQLGVIGISAAEGNVYGHRLTSPNGDHETPHTPSDLSRQFPTPQKDNLRSSPDVVAPSAKLTPTKGGNPELAVHHPNSSKENLNVNTNAGVASSTLDATAMSTPATASSQGQTLTQNITPRQNQNQHQPRAQTRVRATQESPSIYGNASVMDRSLYFSHGLDDMDDDSAVSGLTDIDCATVAEAEWKLTEFLRTETENIKKMLLNTDHEIGNSNGSKNGGNANAGSVKSNYEEREHEDNYSIFTYNRSLVSGERDRVGRAAREAEDMVARMAEATAWMNDPSLLEADSDSDGDGDSPTKKKSSPAGKYLWEDDKELLDWVGYWSGDHGRVYYHNRVTNQTCWTKPQDVEIDLTNVENYVGTGSKSGGSAGNSRSGSKSGGSSKGSKSGRKSGSAGSKHGSSVTGSMSMSSPSKSMMSRSNTLSPPNSDEKVAVKDFTNVHGRADGDADMHKTPSDDAISVSKYTNDHMIKTFRPDSSMKNQSSKRNVNGNRGVTTPATSVSLRKESISNSSHTGISTTPSLDTHQTHGSSTKTSKVMQYRRKRALMARRKRRIAIASFLVLVLGFILVFKREELLQIFGGKAPASAEIKGAKVIDETTRQADALRKLKLAKKLAAVESERKRVAEKRRLEAEANERQREEMKIKKEQERQQQIELDAKRKADTEAEEKRLKLQQAQADAEEKELRLKQAQADEEAKKLKLKQEELERKEKELERQQKERELQLQKEKDEMERSNDIQLHAEMMNRPWACNIPFTYVMSRKCWRVAKLNPIYDCEGITNIMME